MAVSSAARVLDPLGAEDDISPEPRAVPIAVVAAPQSERVAPDLTGVPGTEAVRVVRAGGFIAAIEAVEGGPSEEGTVVEQDPLPGTPLEREAVVTIRLATGCKRTESTDDGAPPPEVREAEDGQDDTEEWFAALAGTRRPNGHDRVKGRRRRKHRYSQPALSELVFEPPPAPLPMQVGFAEVVAPSNRKDSYSKVWLHLRVIVSVAATRLTSLPWTRISAMAVGLLLCVAIVIKAFGPSERRSREMNRAAIASTAPRKVIARKKVTRALRRPGHVVLPRRRRAAGNPRLHTGRAAQAEEVPAHVAEVGASRPSAPAVAHVNTGSRSAAGQFAYLGQ
jgi:hypothetical protein